MKAHIGVDEESGLVHHVECTAANVNDVTQVHRLLHGREDTINGAKVEHPFRVVKCQFRHIKVHSRAGEERGADVHAVRVVEPVDGATTFVAAGGVNPPGERGGPSKAV